MAQLDRASDYGSEGCGFDSCQVRQIKCLSGGIGRRTRLKIWNSSECAGSSPASGTILMHQEEELKMDIEIIRAFKNIEDKLEELKNRNFSDENLKELFNYLEDSFRFSSEKFLFLS